MNSSLAATLAQARPRRRRTLLWLLPAAGGLALATWFFWPPATPLGPVFTTEQVQQGDLALSITATGNLEPTNTVTVGTELSGTVLEVYVRANDTVKAGQPLAKLDTTKLAQQTEAYRAAVRVARAKVAQAQATLQESEAARLRQEKLREVSQGQLPSNAEAATVEATLARARADLASAEASLAQAEMQLQVNETDLGKAVIKAPINGIILTRSVEPGQTVAASFTAPELFTLAEDLGQMKLTVAIAEADIARVAAGQKATFTVDAWPQRRFSAEVTTVSYGSTVTNNVVTYETELTVANDDLSLRPGMTATATLQVVHHPSVLLLPNAALRFKPTAPTADAAAPSTSGNSFLRNLMPGPPRMPARTKAEKQAAPQPGESEVWILVEGRPEPLRLTAGLTDGRVTEVSGEGVSAGLAVITRATLPTP